MRYRIMLGETALTLPQEADGRRHVWHLYVVQHPDRDRLGKALTTASIATGLHYPVPVHLQPAYKHLGHRVGDFPMAERVGRQCLSLPIYPELLPSEQERIAQILKEELVGCAISPVRSSSSS